MAMGVLNHGMREVIPAGVHPRFSALIQLCWQQDPLSRPSFLEVAVPRGFAGASLSRIVVVFRVQPGPLRTGSNQALAVFLCVIIHSVCVK
jgi:hypothetical protein